MKRKEGKAVFLDQDGTIIYDRHYLSDPEKIQVYSGGIAALKKLKSKGWKLIIGTNQSGIGRGYFSLGTLGSIHRKIRSIFQKNQVKIDDIYFCPHHPDEGCSCRKPKTGMLIKAARKHGLNLKSCVVVGDKESDILWGKAVGAKTILVLTGYGREHLPQCRRKADHIARSLSLAADWILKHEN